MVVVMGVTGCGKTTVGELLARRLDARFAEGDTYHPPANVEKMRSGAPLDDADRWPWLEALAADMAAWLAAGERAVVTCSALKRTYRDVLRGAGKGVRFVHVAGSRDVIAQRLSGRRGHYMPPSLLASQIATLEPPDPDEGVITVDLEAAPEAIVTAVLARLGVGDRVAST